MNNDKEKAVRQALETLKHELRLLDQHDSQTDYGDGYYDGVEEAVGLIEDVLNGKENNNG